MGYVSFGRATFDMQAAGEMAASSLAVLKQFPATWEVVDGLVTDIETASAAARQLDGRVDVLMAQFTTFVDARFIDILALKLEVPVILWAVPEPNQQFGGRLSLNSLTGANMAGQMLHKRATPFQFLYGSAAEAEPGTEESEFRERLKQTLRFWTAWKRMQQFTVISLGDAPDGFTFSMPSESAQRQLGIQVRHLNLNDTFAGATNVPESEIEREQARVQTSVRGLDALPQESVHKFAQMMTVLRRDLSELKADAVAVRCWPEFFTQFGAAACSTLSALSDTGTMGSCEADILGALSMDVLYQLTESPAYLGDLVELRPDDGAVVFWHCGAGAFSLARKDTGAVAGKHPNREVGFTLEFGLRPGVVTIFRIGEDYDGRVRALIGRGEVLDRPQRFRGTSAVVRLDGVSDSYGHSSSCPVEGLNNGGHRSDGISERRQNGAGDSVLERVTKVIEAGFEPHYALVYGDVAGELERLMALRGIPVTRF